MKATAARNAVLSTSILIPNHLVAARHRYQALVWESWWTWNVSRAAGCWANVLMVGRPCIDVEMWEYSGLLAEGVGDVMEQMKG